MAWGWGGWRRGRRGGQQDRQRHVNARTGESNNKNKKGDFSEFKCLVKSRDNTDTGQRTPHLMFLTWRHIVQPKTGPWQGLSSGLPMQPTYSQWKKQAKAPVHKQRYSSTFIFKKKGGKKEKDFFFSLKQTKASVHKWCYFSTFTGSVKTN